MNSNGKKENILTSWKEIAVYLDRDVRTCVRWEQRYGLPVHRLDRDSKAKVFAYKDEIDRWLQERSAQMSAPAGDAIPVRRWFRPVPILFALAGLAAAAWFLFFRPSGPDGVPAGLRISGSALVILDARGRELWRHETGLADLLGDEDYEGHFQTKKPSRDYVPIWPYVIIRDLDGDGRREVLFCAKTASELNDGRLICFDDHGVVRWPFDAGRALTFGGAPFRREYRIFGFNVDDYDGDGGLEILVLSFQKPDWPCQAVLLDPAGKTEGEYWNAGYLMDGSAGDVDGDGEKELVLSGVNNEYRRGCVAIFEAGRLRGYSPQTAPAFRTPDLAAGGQSEYILFPTSDVQAATSQVGDPVNYFWIHEGDGLTAWTTQTQIIYDLDRDLACRSVTLSNNFRDLYDKLARAGRVHSVLGDGYKKALADDLLFYEAGKWVGAPARQASRTASRARDPEKK